MGSTCTDLVAKSSKLTKPTVGFHTSQMQQAVSAIAITVDASAQQIRLLSG